MYKIITEWEFMDEFDKMKRSADFTRKGRQRLYEYFTEYEDEAQTGIELDVIAICCTYTEYDSLESLQTDCPDIKNKSDAEENTHVICWDNNCIIIQAY